MINSGFMIFCLQVRDFREINSPSCLCFYVFHAAFDLRSLFDYVNLFQSTMKLSLVLSAFCLLTTGKKKITIHKPLKKILLEKGRQNLFLKRV